MTEKRVSYTLRQTPETFDLIDAAAARSGFQTRSKFLVHAALNQESTDDEAVVQELAQISFLLHQIAAPPEGQSRTFQRRHIAKIAEQACAALAAVVARSK